MDEKNSDEELHYLLYETRGKYFCRIYADGRSSALRKTGVFETRERAISATKKLIDNFHKDADEGNVG